MHKNFRAIYKTSYERVMNRNVDGRTFFQYFYSVFLNQDPTVTEMFVKSDTDVLARLVKDSFKIITSFSKNMVESERLRYVAFIHGPEQRNVNPKLFFHWIESLIDSVRKFDPIFDADVELAWRLVVAPGLTYLEHSYRVQATNM